VGCEVAQIAKSIVFRAGERPVLVIASGANRVDMAKVAAATGFHVKRADGGWVRDVTGFAIGGVAPVAHLTQPVVLVDEDLFSHGRVWAAADRRCMSSPPRPRRCCALRAARRPM
jgi:prolyl-tRNA editing enzyme YbaK/EbsC (Cys-tRNA(Pro) deacylase)